MQQFPRWRRSTAVRSLAVVATLGLALSGCGSDSDEPEAAGDATGTSTAGMSEEGCSGESVKLGQTSPSLLYLPLYVAMGSGAFENAGLEVETADLGGATTVVTALAAGDIDLATVSIGPVASAAQEGGRVKAVANIVDNPGLYIAAKADLMADAGITRDSSFEDKIEFLRDKRLGLVSAGGGTDKLARYLLEQGGMNPDTDTQLLTHDSSSSQVASFVADRVDVVVTSAPVVFTALDEGNGEILWNVPAGDLEQVNGMTNIVLAASSNTVEQNPAVVSCAVEAMAEAIDLIDSDFDAAVEAARQYFEDIDPEEYQRGAEDMTGAIAESLVIDEESLGLALEFLGIDTGGSVSDAFSTIVDDEIAAAVVGG